MKKIFQSTMTLLLLLAINLHLQAQTLDEVLKNYYKNVGAEKWKDLKTMQLEGEVSVQGMTLIMTTLQKRPNLTKSVVSLQGKTFVDAFDGKDAWRINPFAGGDDAVKKDADETKDASKNMFEDDLINYKDKGHKAELQGMEEIDGAKTIKLKLTKKDGDEVLYFFDPENFVPVMIRTFATSGPAKGQAMEIYMSNYEKEGDIMMPHAIANKMNGQTAMEMKINKVTMNPKIEDAEFAFPAKK